MSYEWEKIDYAARPFALLGPCVECGEPIYVPSVVTGDWKRQTMHRNPDQPYTCTIDNYCKPRCFSIPHKWRERESGKGVREDG